MTDEDLQLVWLPTFSGKADDFCAWDGPTVAGRAFLSRYGWWQWHFRRPGQKEQSGRADSELDAKLSLEAEYLKSR